MTGSRCYRRKMMGRGAEGGCGTEEKPCVVSRASTKIPANQKASRREEPLGIDFYTQARKVLSERSPYDVDDAVVSSVSTLPIELADFLSKYSDGRKKHKKSHSESVAKSSGHNLVSQATVSNIWAQTEEYLREVRLNDIENLVAVSLFGSSAMHSCLSIPFVPELVEENARSAASVRTCPNAAEVGSNPAVVVEEVEEQYMEIDCGGADILPQEEMPSSVTLFPPLVDNLSEKEKVSSVTPSSPSFTGLHWLLGSRNKILLTSERPSKKRKLLGGDAGLDRLVVARPLERQGLRLCHVCCLGDTGEHSNRILLCDSCNAAVHQKCYGVQNVPVGSWLCSWCKHKDNVEIGLAGNASVNAGGDFLSMPCVLCPKPGGALKPVAKDAAEREKCGAVKFAHLFCSQWMPEVYVEDRRIMEPIMNIEGIKETRRKLVCYLCKVKYGVCVRCTNGTCRTSFHPICAREAKHQMEIWGKIESDNVELRAFCSKHSEFQDSTGTQQLSPLSVAVDYDSSVSRHSSLTLPVNKLNQLKIGCKNGDKSIVNVKTTDDNAAKSGNFKILMEQDLLTTRTESGCVSRCGDARKLISMERLERNNNGDISSSNSVDFVQILKKIVDRGKASVSDVALEIGISPDSLAAILMGDRPSFFPDLQYKIITWLGNHAYMGTQKNLKLRSNSAISSMVAVAGPEGPDAVAVAGADNPDAVSVKSVPPKRRAKSNLRILKDKKIVCPSKETIIEQNDNGIVIDEINEHPSVRSEDLKDGSGSESHFRNGDCRTNPVVIGKMMMEPSGCQEFGSSVNQSPRSEGNHAKIAHCNIVENNEAAEADTSLHNTLGNIGEDPVCALDGATTVKCDLTNAEIASTSYIHPFILKRVMQIQSPRAKVMSSMAAPSPANICCNHLDQRSTCINNNHVSDAVKLEQLVKARGMGILELSPEDEVEGEIVYFQNKLLDITVSSKHYCDDLIFRVMKCLPEDIDAVRKQKWDAVLVNQYLRELKEARKQGRKEKRHQEAQAVLAAATAAAAASSRISSIRKDGHDEASHHESPLKVNTVSGRAGAYSQLMPRAKETLSRLAVSRVSSGKQSDFFQLTPDFSKENSRTCDICRRSETILNPVLVCCNCKVAVHLGCYCSVKDHIGPWYCELCEDLFPSRSPRAPPLNSPEKPCFVVHCGLCGGTTGAFRKSTDGQWVHAFCAEWVLESTFRRGQVKTVEGMETILKERDVCFICCRKLGVCIKCNYGNCQSTFHPACARNAGLFMHVKSSGGKLQHKLYCEKHSVEQREKAETQQHGAEELKNIKQIRVELERLRLLCERIIKREKLKRELALCSHDILASKRDSVAFSVLVHSRFFAPDSSESATTSLKGHVDEQKSFGKAIQRSDDITVDSKVSGKHRLTHPVPMDINQRTIDSFTSQCPGTQMPIERVLFSEKQLPHRPASIPPRNLVDDVERRSKSRKHTETFQKELVMTSDQASVQNQRLPKGFAYVPIGCLSNEKLVARDTGSHAPLEHDG